MPDSPDDSCIHPCADGRGDPAGDHSALVVSPFPLFHRMQRHREDAVDPPAFPVRRQDPAHLLAKPDTDPRGVAVFELMEQTLQFPSLRKPEYGDKSVHGAISTESFTRHSEQRVGRENAFNGNEGGAVRRTSNTTAETTGGQAFRGHTGRARKEIGSSLGYPDMPTTHIRPDFR